MKKRLAFLLVFVFLLANVVPAFATTDDGNEMAQTNNESSSMMNEQDSNGADANVGGDIRYEDDLTAASTDADINNTSDQYDAAEPYNSKSIVLMDAETGYVLYEQKAQTKRFPASITKIMTTICVLDKLDLDKKITISDSAVNSLEADAAVIGIDAGDEMIVEDALYALMLSSANEVANALAEAASGSIEKFASYMNQKAKQIGCENTHFANPSGLHDEDHYTTAHDMALITQAALKYDFFRTVSSAASYETMETTFGQVYQLTQHHKIVAGNSEYKYKYVEGGKTGYTSKAKNTLVTYAKDSENRELICVLMKASSENAAYKDTIQLFQYGYNEYDWSLVKSEEEIEAEKKAASAASTEAPKEKKTEKKKGGFSFFGFLVKLIIIVVIIGVCYIGGKKYHEKLERERAKLRIHNPKE